MVKIYSRGNNSTTPPTPEGLRNLTGIWGLTEDLRDIAAIQIEELVASLGAARAFSNQEEVNSLLGKIQHKLLGLSFIIKNHINPEDPAAQPIINQGSVEGITNCISYFGSRLPITLKQIVPGNNKAGSMLRMAQIFSKRLNETTRKMAEADNSFVMIASFTSNLHTLLYILERYEYKSSGFEEEYWN